MKNKLNIHTVLEQKKKKLKKKKIQKTIWLWYI